MNHIAITCEQREAMLRAVGVEGVEELFGDIPPAARLDRPLDLPGGLSEIDLVSHLRMLSGRNDPASGLVSFAGAGCYDHYVPSLVDHVVSRPEFFTAYTPYQPEVSQGTLQAIYEYQTMICELTGMDVSNASMYDGATALAEAAMMAVRITKRHRVLVDGSVHPEWVQVLRTYASSGIFSLESLAGDPDLIGDDVAALLVQNPAFTGTLADLATLGSAAHAAGALLVVAANPILLGVLEPPSVFGADIVVGEGQPLGNTMSFGGPGLGFFAARQQHIRQMPGRIVGATVDVDGARAFVLTMATREQHIRREKATSNICSNHALNALAAGAYLAAVGSEGLADIASACVAKAHYLHDGLVATGRFTASDGKPFGYEFALRYEGDVSAMQAAALERGYLAGVSAYELSGDEAHKQVVIFAVTEKRTRAQMDAFVAEVVSL